MADKTNLSPVPASATMPLLKRLIGTYLRPYFGQVFLAVLLMGCAAALTASFALMIEPVFDDILTNGRLSVVWGLAATVLAIFIMRGVLTYLHTVVMSKIGQSVASDIQNHMMSHFMTLDLRFFHSNPSGQLLSRIVNDVNVMRATVSELAINLGKNFLSLIFLIGVMFYQDWKLAIAAFIFFPLCAAFVVWIGRRLRKMSGRIQDYMAELSDRLSQVFQGVRLVKAYGMEDHEKAQTAKAVARLRNNIVKTARIGNLSTPVIDTLVGIVVFGVIVYGGYQVAAGLTTPGKLISFITAFSLAYEPLKKLAKLNNNLQTGLGAADRVFALLDTHSDVTEKDGAVPLVVSQPDIRFDNVSFHYEEDSRPALENVSFLIPGGKVTALVGRSGSGKTTIMNLIPRFFDVGAGAVLIDGHDVRDVTMESLRANIALVSQDITIFNDTVWANIGYGRKGAYQDEIIKAAIAAEADAFIRQLPDGYDTILGEEGVKLSGGQKQRISIARAILRDAPILLLDEATSALDNEAERAIQETLSLLQEGRTTLVIAHRLSTVRNADQIVVMEGGQVAEIGRHDDLLARGGVYARIHAAGLRE
jgi:subfamily B ATP-binding cassette protein MsbA